MKPVIAVLLLYTSLFQAGAATAQSEFGPAFSHHVPLAGTGAGSFVLEARLGGVQGEFLLDTGASMITVSRRFFAKIEASGAVTHQRQVAARMASGKIQALDVYLIEDFSLGADCRLGPVEVAVLKGGDRNLLGMSALALAAPFAVYTTPPSLGLSNCGHPPPGFAAR